MSKTIKCAMCKDFDSVYACACGYSDPISFSDEDLEQWKERFQGSMSDPFRAEALIARLEAAEKAMLDLKGDAEDTVLVYEWRKAAGKEK